MDDAAFGWYPCIVVSPPGAVCRLRRRSGVTRDGTPRPRRTEFLSNFFMPYDNDGFSHPSPDEIAYCAYLIWEKEGRPAGRAKEHWLQAETQLMATRAHDGWTTRPEPARTHQNS
jgi:hypothetical protein